MPASVGLLEWQDHSEQELAAREDEELQHSGQLAEADRGCTQELHVELFEGVVTAIGWFLGITSGGGEY